MKLPYRVFVEDLGVDPLARRVGGKATFDCMDVVVMDQSEDGCTVVLGVDHMGESPVRAMLGGSPRLAEDFDLLPALSVTVYERKTASLTIYKPPPLKRRRKAA